MKCPKCDAEILSDTTHCENCGTYVGAANRRSWIKNRALIISVIAAVVVVFFVSMSGKLGKKASNNSSNNSKSTSSYQSADSATYHRSTATEKPTENHEQIIYDKNGVKVICLGYNTSGTLPEISFRVENNSDYDIFVTTDKLSINDFMIGRSLLCEVAKGKKALDGIVMFSNDLTDCGITKIESIEFTLKISQADYYGSSPIDDSVLVTIDY